MEQQAQVTTGIDISPVSHEEYMKELNFSTEIVKALSVVLQDINKKNVILDDDTIATIHAALEL